MGELVRLGTLSAASARDLTQAQLICESKLAEISAGITPAESISYAEYELDPSWLYSVELAPIDAPPGVRMKVSFPVLIQASSPMRMKLIAEPPRASRPAMPDIANW